MIQSQIPDGIRSSLVYSQLFELKKKPDLTLPRIFRVFGKILMQISSEFYLSARVGALHKNKGRREKQVNRSEKQHSRSSMLRLVYLRRGAFSGKLELLVSRRLKIKANIRIISPAPICPALKEQFGSNRHRITALSPAFFRLRRIEPLDCILSVRRR